MDWFEKPTIQTHLHRHVPFVDWNVDQSWDWPFWKFGFKHPDVLFGQLHAEFNSIRCAIQDPYGWHLDVCEIASVANDREEFFNLLRERQDERYMELEKVWHKTRSLMVGEPSRWDIPQSSHDLWANFMRISRNFSYDAFVGYFGAYIKGKDEATAILTDGPTADSDRQQHPTTQQDDIHVEGRLDSRTMRVERDRRNIERVEGSRVGLAKRKAAQPDCPASASPNRVIKRQRRSSRSSTPSQDRLRRSARLQQKRRKSC